MVDESREEKGKKEWRRDVKTKEKREEDKIK